MPRQPGGGRRSLPERAARSWAAKHLPDLELTAAEVGLVAAPLSRETWLALGDLVQRQRDEPRRRMARREDQRSQVALAEHPGGEHLGGGLVLLLDGHVARSSATASSAELGRAIAEANDAAVKALLAQGRWLASLMGDDGAVITEFGAEERPREHLAMLEGMAAELRREERATGRPATQVPGPDPRTRESIGMRLPDHVPVSPEAVRAIAARHGLGDRSLRPLADTGIINAVYLLGDDLLLRVPRDHIGHVAQARVEAVAIPAARAAGVRTPALVAYDDARDLLPVPYLVVERVRGRALSDLDLDPGETPDVWREVGRDLARLHTGAGPNGPVGELWVRRDPRELVEERAADGWFTGLEARWLGAWLDRIAPAALSVPAVERLLHRDPQTTNVMVGSESIVYVAILDWGCAGLGDPAWDFWGMPLRAVPFALEGHRQVAPLDADDTAEARILWRHLQASLTHLPRGAVPALSWGERPLAWLLEVLRFFLDGPPPAWRALAP